jgi:RNA polymerase sigma factor (sigma-70 family)
MGEKSYEAMREEYNRLLAQALTGDRAAFTAFVEKHGDTCRRVIRWMLNRTPLRPLVDSNDILQSVLAGLWAKASAPGLNLDKREDAARYFITVARNKITDKLRKLGAECTHREGRDAAALEGESAVAVADDPGEGVATRDMLDVAKHLMSEDEWYLACARAEGWTWAELAAASDESAEAIRKRHNRALARVAEQMSEGSDNPTSG